MFSHREQLNLKEKGGFGGDQPARAAVPVAELRGDGQLALLADAHPLHALVPALDHLPTAQLEAKWVTAVVRRVELLAVGQSAEVVDLQVTTQCT